jgi:hypothetical protein
MKKSQSVAKLTVALSKVHNELNHFKTDKAGYNFSYLSTSEIYRVALPILSKNGLALSSTNCVFTRDDIPWVKVQTTLYFEDEFIANETSFPMLQPTKKTDTDIMMYGSTVSYLVRYNVQGLLSIAGSDKDAEQIVSEQLEEQIKIK